MGQALDTHTEKGDFQSVGDLLDDYIRHLNEKPQYIRTGLSKLDENLHLVPGNYFCDRRQTQRRQNCPEPSAGSRHGKAGQASVLFQP